MATQIKVQAKPSGNFETVFYTAPGRLVFRCLELAEQAKTSRVSKRWNTNLDREQRTFLTAQFPENQLHLVGGALTDAIPLRNIARVQSGVLRTLPNLAVGWIQVEPKVWTLFVFKREPSRDPTEQHHNLLYYFSRLPDAECNWQLKDIEGGKQEKAMGSMTMGQHAKDPILSKIGLWEIAGSCCPKEISCGEIWHCNCCSTPCCCWTGHCFPWEIWSKIGFLFNCGKTRSLYEDRTQRRNTAYQSPIDPKSVGNAVHYNYQGTRYFPLTEPSFFYDWTTFPTTCLDSPTTWFAVLRDERAPLPKNEAPKPDKEVEPVRRASLTVPIDRSTSSVSVALQESKKDENAKI